MNDHSNTNAFVTSLDLLFSWSRRSALWWLQYGLACCGMEMVAASMSRFDLSERYGMWFRSSPRQADLMFVAGTVTKKMAPVVRTLYDQMPEPKWVIAMGSCACSGGPYDTYAVLQGVDQLIPVDVYVPGCPPTPEALYFGVLTLQDRIIGHAAIARRLGNADANVWRRRARETTRDASRLPDNQAAQGIVLHNVGRNQEQFIEAFGKDVLPEVMRQ